MPDAARGRARSACRIDAEHDARVVGRRRSRPRTTRCSRRSPGSSRSPSSVAGCAPRPAAAAGLAEANELRTALLAAVSHDLRTPLASIKASATSLLQHDVELDRRERRSEFLETIDEETDRLDTLVGNLLDMSRLQSGRARARVARRRPRRGRARRRSQSLGDTSRRRRRSTCPRRSRGSRADAALLERAIANVIGNALRCVAARSARSASTRARSRGPRRPAGRRPRAPASRVDQREQVFRPFQRLGDQPNGDGVGLGLAVARGFVEAMGGELTVEDTPGGGATVVHHAADRLRGRSDA